MNDSDPNKDVTTLKLELELEKLERRWLEEKQPYLYRGQEVTVRWAVAGGLIMVALGIVFISVGLSQLSDRERTIMGPSPIVVGALAICLGLLGGAHSVRKARAYNDAKQRYEHRRRKLVADISIGQQEAGGPNWNCPSCGEAVPDTFDVCWNCAASRPDNDAVPD